MKLNKLHCAVSMAMGVAFAMPAVAQQAESAEAAAEVEKIQVTGSRLKGVDLEGAQPLTVLDSEAIERSGASNVSELMQTLAQTRGGSGSFSTAESGATSTSTPAGQAAASLRGLGPSSTLTLINGRRVAASSFAAGTENFVDINSIPLSAIDRVEVLATGASAIYGADAVAGVINYILKDDFRGMDIDVSYENGTTNSDEGRLNLNFIWGGEVAGGNLTLFADYYDRNSFHAQDRDFTRDPALNSYYSYLPKLKDGANVYYLSSKDGNEIGSPVCSRELVTTEFDEQICAYYGNYDDELIAPLESMSAGFTYNKEIGDLVWNTDVFFSQTDSSAQSSPAPIDRLDDSEGPFAWEWALDDAFSPEQLDNWLGTTDITDAIWLDPWDIFPNSAETVAGRQLYGFAFDARFNDPRTVEIETQAVRLVSTLEGSIDYWDWEAGVMYSRSKSDQTATQGIYNRYKFHAALAGELCSDGSIANYDADADVLNCSSGNLLDYYNPFLIGNEQNDATLALAQAMPTREGTSTVYGIDGQISGDLFEMPAGYVSSAFGFEWRKEEITDTPSANAVANPNAAAGPYIVDVFGFGSSISQAERTQWGAFAEFMFPLAEGLNLQAAGRYDHYDKFGGTFNPMLSLSYRATDELMLRASWATAFRAPSLTQAGVELRTTRSQFDCGANDGISRLYCAGGGAIQSTNVLQLGNNDLEAEESESVSLGLAYSPSAETTVTLDYWQFDHDKLVDTNFTGFLDRSLTDHTVRYCGTQLIPDGELGLFFDENVCAVTDQSGLDITQQGANLDEILDAYVAEFDPRDPLLEWDRDHVIRLENIGRQEVKGLDFSVDHGFALGDLDAHVRFDATHYLDYTRDIGGTDQIEELIGTYRYPENIASLSFNLDGENAWGGIRINFTDGYDDDTDGRRSRVLLELVDKGVVQELDQLDNGGFAFLDSGEAYNGSVVKDDDGYFYTQNEISSWTTVDLNFGYALSDEATLRLNINNVFDRMPPRSYGSQRGFDSINHDVLGTTYRLSFTYLFD